MAGIRIGLVGVGKIARDQHLPALQAGSDFELVAYASHAGHVDGIDGYRDVAQMLEARPDIQAVSLCTPPAGRFEQAMSVIASGRHLMLEKPPAGTVCEVDEIARAARKAGVTMFTTWHSREAAAVEAARNRLATRCITAVRIDWKEDIRRWHPGQDWLLAAGGFGVFDPGINALSIATYILPQALLVTGATLSVPSNRDSPIAAAVRMAMAGAVVEARFDFLQTGQQQWSIEIDTDAGTLRLLDGGRRLDQPGRGEVSGPNDEYARLYRKFGQLIATGASDVDLRPLRLVADAFLVADRRIVDAFHF